MSSAPPGGITFRDRHGHRIGTLSVASVLAWLAIVIPVVVAAESTRAAAPTTPWWPAIVLVLLAVASADLPDSMFPLVTVLVAVGWWIVVVDQVLIGPTLAVALALLVFHAATSHAALGPPGRDGDRALLGPALTRIAAVGSATLALAAIAAATAGRAVVPVGVLGPALLAVGALPWLARHLLGVRDAQRTFRRAD